MRAVSMDSGTDAASLQMGDVPNPYERKPKSILKSPTGGLKNAIKVKFADTALRRPLDQQTNLPRGTSRDEDMMKLLRSLSTLHPKKPAISKAWTVAERSYGVCDSALDSKDNVIDIDLRLTNKCSKIS